MPRGEEGAAGAEGTVLAGMNSMGNGEEPYQTLVWQGVVLERVVPRLFSSVWVVRPDPWFTPCPLLFRDVEAPMQGLCATSKVTK